MAMETQHNKMLSGLVVSPSQMPSDEFAGIFSTNAQYDSAHTTKQKRKQDI